jgi:type IV pilus assembly protein PilB
MIILNELLKRNILSELQVRDIVGKIDDGDVLTVDDAFKVFNVQASLVKQIRSEIFALPTFDTVIKLDLDNINYLDQSMARKYKILPLAFSDNTLSVGLVDPENQDTVSVIENSTIKNGIKYKLFLISQDQFEAGLVEYFNANVEEESAKSLVLGDVNSTVGDLDKKEATDITKFDQDLSKNITDDSVDTIVNTLINQALKQDVSDIHIEHLGDSLRVRYRIDGVLEKKLELPPSMHSSLIAKVKILSDMKLDEKRKPQDGRFSVRIEGHKVDFRVSSMPGYYGEKVVIRILDSYRGIRKLENMGFSELHLKQIRNALQRPYGMILISGPTGSGKTTTLYSMINEIDRDKRNVVSLEDPIEYNVSGMNQSQIFPEIGYNFSTGLRSILRQDPDVIMVGEIRDAETAQLAVQAALTGHLVFSTIHTNNSVGVITRLIDMGVDPFLIAPTLCLSVAQRLVPQIYPKCEAPLEMGEGLKAMIKKEFEELPESFREKLDLSRPVYQALPNEIAPSGTKGRVPVLEILELDDDIQNAIVNRKSEDDLWKIAKSKGMITMKQDAIIKSMNKIVPFVEIAGL